jgi:hypothetical protein
MALVKIQALFQIKDMDMRKIKDMVTEKIRDMVMDKIKDLGIIVGITDITGIMVFD